MNGVMGCWQVHTYLNSDPLTCDTMTLQAKNNDQQVCKASQCIAGASAETVWTLSCGNLKFTMTNNGQKGHVSGENTSC